MQIMLKSYANCLRLDDDNCRGFMGWRELE